MNNFLNTGADLQEASATVTDCQTTYKTSCENHRGFDYALALKCLGIQVADNGLVLGTISSHKLVALMKLTATFSIIAIKLSSDEDFEKLHKFITDNQLLDDVGDVRELFLVQRLKEYFHLL